MSRKPINHRNPVFHQVFMASATLQFALIRGNFAVLQIFKVVILAKISPLAVIIVKMATSELKNLKNIATPF